MKVKFLIFIALITLFNGTIYSQNENVIPVQVKEEFSNIKLVSGDGTSVDIPEEGRNTILVFIRGKVTPTVWCPICHYQYLEMVDELINTNLAEKYDVDIYFVMPYLKDSLNNWIDAFPTSLSIIDGWKNPKDESEAAISWRDYCRMFFSEDFTFDIDNPELKIPVLFDEDQKVSNGLLLYKQEWGGTKVPQNIPTIYIIDKNKKVKFKYHSQYTNDRPDAAYLIQVIENLL